MHWVFSHGSNFFLRFYFAFLGLEIGNDNNRPFVSSASPW